MIPNKYGHPLSLCVECGGIATYEVTPSCGVWDCTSCGFVLDCVECGATANVATDHPATR